jgi:hypothetical protein
LHGYCGVVSLSSPTPSAPPLPADATKRVFGAPAIALDSEVEEIEPPRLAFATSAPIAPA